MTGPSPLSIAMASHNSGNLKRVSNLSSYGETKLLSLHDDYGCPICGTGRLSAIVLTDAFACNFCRHIFTANLANQSIQVVDTAQPMVWFWSGSRWQSQRQGNTRLTLTVCLIALALSGFPAAIIELSSHIFPPLHPTPGLRFSTVWSAIALLAHEGIALWLIAEHYQWPWYVSTKVRLQQWRYE